MMASFIPWPRTSEYPTSGTKSVAANRKNVTEEELLPINELKSEYSVGETPKIPT
jgi:hypothetical protein